MRGETRRTHPPDCTPCCKNNWEAIKVRSICSLIQLYAISIIITWCRVSSSSSSSSSGRGCSAHHGNVPPSVPVWHQCRYFVSRGTRVVSCLINLDDRIQYCVKCLDIYWIFSSADNGRIKLLDKVMHETKCLPSPNCVTVEIDGGDWR